MFEILLAIGEFFHRLFQGLTAWRYIFYSNFRKATHERWRVMRRIIVIEEVIGGILGIIITIAAIGLIILMIL